MLKPLLIALTLLLLAAPSHANNTATRLLVLGDSISAAYGLPRDEGWVALLDDYLKNEKLDFEVINASISGDTTQGGKARLPALLQTYQPAIVILELGANDGLRGFPLHIMRDNLRQMIRQSRDSGARVLLVGMRIPPNYGSKYTAMFYDSFHGLAEEEQISLVPFFLEGVAAHDGMMQADGLHPTARAQDILFRNVLPGLLPLLEPQNPSQPAS